MHKPSISAAVAARAIERRGSVRVFKSLVPERTAHIVVDLQNGFMAPGEVAEIGNAREIVPAVNRISAALRDAGGIVVYIQNTFDDLAVSTWSTFFDHFCSPARRQRMIDDDHLRGFTYSDSRAGRSESRRRRPPTTSPTVTRPRRLQHVTAAYRMRTARIAAVKQ